MKEPMARVKLTDKGLKDDPVGGVILQIRGLARQMSSTSKRLEACFVTSLETSEPIVDPFLVKAILSELESQALTLPYLDSQTLSRLQTFITKECSIAANSFELQLRRLCEENRISLEGRFPNYVLAGFLQVVVEQAKETCRVDVKTINSLMLESIAPTILDMLSSEAERPFEVLSFLKELRGAYERSIRLKGLNMGQPVQILDVFSELVFVKQSAAFRRTPTTSRFREYTREYFSRDLARVSAAGSSVSDGKRLELMPTAFPHEDGLPIRTGEKVRYAGSLAFTMVST